MENQSPFYSTKIMDVGTSHPVMARIACGISDLLDHSELSKEKKTNLKDLCFDIATDLIEAEKQAKPVIQEIKKIEKNLESAKSTTRPDSIESVISIENTRSFLKFGKSALRKFACALAIIFDEGFNDPKFKDISEKLKKKLTGSPGEEFLILKILEHYQPFADELVGRRNEDEHGHYSKVFLLNYSIEKHKGYLILRRPCFKDKTHIFEYLKQATPMLLHFIEESLMAAVSMNLNPLIAICEIPEERRDPKSPKRFRLDLYGHAVLR